MEPSDLDPERHQAAMDEADELHGEAEEMRRYADSIDAQAQQIERTWMIPSPCHLCGRRSCGH